MSYGIDGKWALQYLCRDDVYLLHAVTGKNKGKQWEPIYPGINLDEVTSLAIYSSYHELVRNQAPGYERTIRPKYDFCKADICDEDFSDADVLVLEMDYIETAYYARVERDEKGQIMIKAVREANLQELAHEMVTMRFERREDKLLSYLIYTCAMTGTMSEWQSALDQAVKQYCYYREVMEQGI